MYTASITKIKISEIDGAKTIAKGILPGGTEVVVSKDTPDGSLGVFFPEDGQISPDFLMANSLYRKHPETGLSMGGYFEANGRVRAQKFMGIKSAGFWCPLAYLENMGIRIDELQEGQTFDVLQGKHVCWKYETPATKAARAAQIKAEPVVKVVLPRHYDTPRVDQAGDKLDNDDWVVITEKIHGTSAATGLVPCYDRESWRTRLLTWVAAKLNVRVSPYRYEIQSRTRNTLLAARPDIHHTNSADAYRLTVMKTVEPYLHLGETLYYEIAGYDSNGGLIMPSGDNSKLDKSFRAEYGDRMTFTYGCNLDTMPRQVFVYRITYVAPDGAVVELPWGQVEKRCHDLGLQTVPVVWTGIWGDIAPVLDSIVEGPSTIDPTHIREGICIRAEQANGETLVLKQKSHAFRILEGHIKEADTYVDAEEVN